MSVSPSKELYKCLIMLPELVLKSISVALIFLLFVFLISERIDTTLLVSAKPIFVLLQLHDLLIKCQKHHGQFSRILGKLFPSMLDGFQYLETVFRYCLKELRNYNRKLFLRPPQK